MKKLTETANILDKLCAVLFWLLAILGGIGVAILTTVGILTGRGIPADAASSTGSVTLGMLKLEVAKEYVINNMTGSGFFAGIVVLAAAVVVDCWTIKLFRNILDPMKNGQPFAEKTASTLRGLGWLTLIGGVVIEILQAVTMFLTVSNMDIKQLFNTEAVKHCTVQLDANLYFVVEAIVFFLLSYIFRYGCELQQQADETL